MNIRIKSLLRSMIVIGALVFSICGSLSFYYIDQEISAEAVQIDDGPLGEKIVDLEVVRDPNRADYSTAYYAITENGHVYSWGDNDSGRLGNGTKVSKSIPGKVLNEENDNLSEPYLNDIVKVKGSAGSVFAINSKGELFAWGDNRGYNLGLGHNSEVLRPTKVSLPFKVKDISPISSYNRSELFTFLLSESGDVYVVGKVSVGSGTLGLGEVAEVKEFTKVEVDDNGDALPKIKQIFAAESHCFMLPDCDNDTCIDGIYATGPNDGYGANKGSKYPKFGMKLDGTILTGVKEIITVAYASGAAIVRLNDNDIYISNKYRVGDIGYMSVLDPANNLLDDSNEYFKKVIQFSGVMNEDRLFISDDNKIYWLDNYNGWFDKASSVSKFTGIGDIPEDYTNAKKVFSYEEAGRGITVTILSNNGAVYINGKKIRFGEISVSGIKEKENTTYINAEKYNDNVVLKLDVVSNSRVELNETDLETNENVIKELTELDIRYEAVENKHINKKLKFNATNGSEVYSISYVIDLFNSDPVLNNYTIGVTNYIAPSTQISLNVPSKQKDWNSYKASITKPDNTTVNYNGEALSELGTYTLHVTDEYGNTADYQFETTSKPIPTFNFEPKYNAITYGEIGSKSDDVLGNIKLNYTDDITSIIQTIAFVPGGDEDKFILENDGTLKVGNSNLDAGTYTLNITGTDGNNMPFTGTITIVIEKADQPDYKIVTGVKLEEVYGFIFKLNDTIQIGTKGKLSGGAETLAITSGNGTIASLKGTTPESFEMLATGKFTIEATIAGDANYKEKTISQEITLSDKEVQKGFGITSSNQMIYGSTYQPTASGGESDGAISWSITNDNGTSAVINSNGTINVSAIGSFTLNAKKAGNATYQDVSDSITVTVNPLSVTVKPNNVNIKTGQAFTDQGVTYTPNIISGDTSKIGTPVISTTYQVGDGAGSYDITITGGLANPNYTFTYTKGTLTVNDVTLPEPSDQEKSSYYEVTGTKGKNGWYTSDIQIKTTGKDGYTKISQTNGSFTGDTITVSTEGETDISLYFQHTDGTITKPIIYKAKIDKTAPSIPTMTVDEINTSRMARFINLLSFGSWMNEEAQVTMLSNDGISGIDHYEYIETIKGSDSQPKSTNGILTYGDETELLLKARACDKAGNCSTYSISEELKIDKKGPTILGVKDQSVYKQYYSPRFVTVTDLVSGLKQATYKKDGNSAGAFADNVETPIKGEGSYEIYAIDEAGNEITITFKILKLPNIDTEIDGSDESRELIDQIIKEYEEVKNKIDPNEKDNYEQWIKDAEEKWESLRKKVIEHEETTSKVEGQGDTNFDPSTKLIVEEIPKDNVPVLPRNAIKTYDVRLMKGDKEILPNGDIKVYLPYTEQEAPIVYEIDDDGTITELPSQQENGYVTFITNTLKKYAISNTKQEENKDPDNINGGGGDTPNPDDGKDPDNNKPDPNPDDGKNPDDNNDPTDDDKVCSVGPDGKQNTSDDVCGKPNDEGDKPVINPDGSVTVPDGGSVIFPDGSEVELPDGGTIKPDGSVELPDGTIYDKDGNKKEPNKKQCDIKDKYLNIDSDGDGRPDVNLDIDGDCYPDLNIDTDNDGYPNVNIDTTGDGKPNINIDTDNDGKADINIVLKLPAWNPKLNATVDGFDYDTMSGIEPDLNVDTTGDGKPNINVDTDGDGYPDQNVEDDWYTKRGLEKPSSNTNVKGNYTKGDTNTGGVSTGDNTKWYIWLFLMFCTLSTMGYNYYRKHKQK